jgi:hypothetical protein
MSIPEPYKIFDFGEVSLSAEQLLSVKPHRLDFIIRSGLAANDVAIFLRLYMMYFHDDFKDAVVKEISSLNAVVMQRNLLAKLYEFIKLYEIFRTQCDRAKDYELLPMVHVALDRTDELKAHKAYTVMDTARNEITNHYVTRGNEAHLRQYKSGQRLKMYLHLNTGNSYYPVAEELSYLSHISLSEDAGVSVEDIMTWGQAAAGALLFFQQKLTIRIFQLDLPNLRSKATKVFVPGRLVGTEDSRGPILIDIQGDY